MAIFTLAVVAPRAVGQAPAHEDLTPCPGSAAEPAQSGAWSVAFCNRTGHDLVLEFHDNDCPANDWSRRGDIYQRTLRKDEAKTFPLCYAKEPAVKDLAPGVPAIRIPGGKGVVTTWSVIGDCGERSRALNLDAKTFYDRGEYKTGIILLQSPAGAPHCAADGLGAASTSAPAATSSAMAAPAAAAGAAAAGGAATAATARAAAPTVEAPHSAGTAGAASPSSAATAGPSAAAPAPVNNRSHDAPTLSAAIDSKDVIGRTVRVFAKGGAGYNCTFNLAVSFTDGVSWNDRATVGITAGDADAPISTRKYLKSVSKVQVASSKCAPM